MRQNRKHNPLNLQKPSNMQELNKNLMSKLTEAQNTQKNYKKHFLQDINEPKCKFQLIDLGIGNPYNHVLQKAKTITRLHKSQIEKAKSSIKKSQKDSEGAFLTGCGLYTSEDNQQFNQFPQQNEKIDLNDALKYLVNNQKDDLIQLRKLIRKTNTNLNTYSNSMNRTQNEVQSAAQIFGKQINLQLKMRITKCGFNKLSEPQTTSKRKISTSSRPKI